MTTNMQDNEKAIKLKLLIESADIAKGFVVDSSKLPEVAGQIAKGLYDVLNNWQ